MTAEVLRPDGVALALERRGEGPPVVMAPYWSGHPGVFADLLADLARDHETITYDARGTGRSTRRGPYDMNTDCADLEAVLESAGGGAVVLAIANGANQAARVAAERPELVLAVVAIGTPPISRSSFQGTEGMIGSDAVVDAFLEMLSSDYRAALRTLLTATNEQMDERELAERVRFQSEYAPSEATVSRVRAWANDDPDEVAGGIGDRLWIITSENVAGPWLPPEADRERLVAELLPEAHVERVEDGAVSRPDLTASLIRRITAGSPRPATGGVRSSRARA